MSKITDESTRAFKQARRFKKSNSEIKIEPSWNVYYRLFGNLIALYSPRAKELTISDCGRQSKTTKERLNWILSEFGLWGIIQRNWNWYLVDKNWNETKWTGLYFFNL